MVAREKASNEAKSEFMSLMCHEVRTPLNGCLASAEMLLATALEVPPYSHTHALHYTRTSSHPCMELTATSCGRWDRQGVQCTANTLVRAAC